MDLQKNFKPQQIGIELVKGCNFSCQMCPVPLYREESVWEFISLELLDKLVTEIEAHDSIKTIWLVHFGEPLAHPKLRECFEILNRVHLKFKRKVILHTNASLLKGEKVAALLDTSVVTDLTFSFDGFGDKASFEFLRGNHFDKVMQNITHFSEQAVLRRPDLKLSTCSVVPKAEEIKGWGGYVPSAEEVHNNYIKIFEPLNIVVNQRAMIDFSGNEVLPITSNKPDKVFGGCHFVEKDSLYFAVTGKAQPCCNVFNEEFNVGDIQSSNFDALLNNDKMNGIRHLLRLDQREQLPFCKNCSLSNGRNLSAEQLLQFWTARNTDYPLNALEKQHIFGLVDPGVINVNDAQLLLDIWQRRNASKPDKVEKTTPEGHIDAVVIDVDKLSITGWAADLLDGSPLTHFTVLLDDVVWTIDTVTWSMRSDVAASFQRSEWKFSGFTLSLSGVAVGDHQLKIQIANSTGLIMELVKRVTVL
ncbi:MAG: radical SAM protein [Methylococcaceae bacterium]|nr:radical SAM protein [Methylococcaceae bacterium]